MILGWKLGHSLVRQPHHSKSLFSSIILTNVYFNDSFYASYESFLKQWTKLRVICIYISLLFVANIRFWSNYKRWLLKLSRLYLKFPFLLLSI